MKNLIKFIIAGICFFPLIAVAEEIISQTEIDLDSIRYSKSKNTAEIKVNVYNQNYESGVDNMYYASYYMKMYCGQNMYKPLMIEGYNKDNQLLLVDYAKYEPQRIVEDSDISQAYSFACQYASIPTVNKTKEKKSKEKKD